VVVVVMVEVTWWLWRGGGDVAVVGAVVVLWTRTACKLKRT